MTKQSTQWVTIQEERIHTPVSNAENSAKPKKSKQDPVKHKFFWGVGFAAVMIVSFAMLAPQQFGAVLQGNLFDAPGVTEPEAAQQLPPLGIVSTGHQAGQTIAEEAPEAPHADVTVVQPETSPVSIQIAPVGSESAEPETEKEPDANQRLIEELKQQVSALQDQQAAPLSGLPAPDLHTAAAPQAAGFTATVGAQPGYRVNSHRVTIHPQTVLQQRMSGGYVAPASAVPTAARVTAPAYSANLGNVQGTPESGPSEVLAIMFLITFVGLLGWKGITLART